MDEEEDENSYLSKTFNKRAERCFLKGFYFQILVLYTENFGCLL